MRGIWILTALILLAGLADAGKGVRRAKPRLFVVAVGIDEYGEGYPKLSLCEKDATGVVAALTAERNKGVFSSIESRLLVNATATGDDIAETLLGLADVTTNEDVVVFYFAGGTNAGIESGFDGGELLFLPSDAVRENRDSKMSGQLLADLISRIPSRSQLVILDTCVLEATARTLLAGLTAEARELGDLVDRRQLVLCPSGVAYAYSGMQHGVFTSALLRCLSPEGDLDGSGIVTARELEAAMPVALYKVAGGRRRITDEMRVRAGSVGKDFPVLSVGAATRGAPSRGFGPSKPETKKAAKPAERKNYALLFATDDYEHWSDLSNPVFDATALKKELETAYGFEVELVKDATYARMLKTFDTYSKKQFGPDDQLLVFFAGHGHYHEQTRQGYVISRDSTMPAGLIPPKDALNHDSVQRILDNSPCQHVLVVLDVCFGGTFKQDASKAGSRGGGLYDVVDREQAIRRQLAYKSRFYLASGGKVYVSDGIAGRHSPFAYRLLGGLRGEAGKKGLITFHALADHVAGLKTKPKGGRFGGSEAGASFFLERKQ
ncbi:MAG: caspase family protein [Planctomycetota bacterium]|jgi:uncharacterized caspase-like protein